jgi:hypothetical protein
MTTVEERAKQWAVEHSNCQNEYLLAIEAYLAGCADLTGYEDVE